MRNKAIPDRECLIPGDAADSPEKRRPSSEDIWQAASLLIGVYGRQAVDYAIQRRDRLDDGGDGSGAMIWDLILSRIEVQLRAAPARCLN